MDISSKSISYDSNYTDIFAKEYLELNKYLTNDTNLSFSDKISIDPETNKVTLHKEKCLILSVDDDEVNQMVIAGTLEEEGYSVVEAMDGFEALAYMNHCIADRYEYPKPLPTKNEPFYSEASNSSNEVDRKSYKGLPDLILLDIMMPGLSGYEVCDELRRTHPASIPIILISAKNTREDIVKGLSYNANGYITKPFDKRELVARVNSCVTLHCQRRLDLSFDVVNQYLHRFIANGDHGIGQDFNSQASSNRLSYGERLSNVSVGKISFLMGSGSDVAIKSTNDSTNKTMSDIWEKTAINLQKILTLYPMIHVSPSVDGIYLFTWDDGCDNKIPIEESGDDISGLSQKNPKRISIHGRSGFDTVTSTFSDPDMLKTKNVCLLEAVHSLVLTFLSDSTHAYGSVYLCDYVDVLIIDDPIARYVLLGQELNYLSAISKICNPGDVLLSEEFTSIVSSELKLLDRIVLFQRDFKTKGNYVLLDRRNVVVLKSIVNPFSPLISQGNIDNVKTNKKQKKQATRSLTNGSSGTLNNTSDEDNQTTDKNISAYDQTTMSESSVNETSAPCLIPLSTAGGQRGFASTDKRLFVSMGGTQQRKSMSLNSTDPDDEIPIEQVFSTEEIFEGLIDFNIFGGGSEGHMQNTDDYVLNMSSSTHHQGSFCFNDLVKDLDDVLFSDDIPIENKMNKLIFLEKIVDNLNTFSHDSVGKTLVDIADEFSSLKLNYESN